MNKCILLIGPPCSGKSTVGKELALSLGYKYISSGDIARKMAEEDDSTDSLNAGNMAPEDRMREEIAKIFNNGGNIVLDGFPRFEEQWKWLMSRFFNYEFAYVVIDVPTLTLFDRAANRGRADDISFMNRMEYYMKNTAPMINQMDSHSMLYGIPMVCVMNNNVKLTVTSIEEYLNGCSWL